MYKYLIALLVVCSSALPAQAGGKGRGHGCHGGIAAGYGCNGGGLRVGYAVTAVGYGCNGGGWRVGYGCNGGSWQVGYGCNGGSWQVGYGCNGGAAIGNGCFGGMPTNGPRANRLPDGSIVIEDKPLAPAAPRIEPGQQKNGQVPVSTPTDASNGAPASGTDAPVEDLGPPEPEAAKPVPATLVVHLPTEAKLTINNTPSRLTSATRTFVSPALSPGKEYYYTLEAEMEVNGQVARTTNRVALRAGEKKEVLLEFSGARAAAP